MKQDLNKDSVTVSFCCKISELEHNQHILRELSKNQHHIIVLKESK